MPDLPWQALARGAELFNQGLYWEAHEAWEELWLELDDEPKLFVQGLIQAAAAGHKAFVQLQPRGCVKLLGTALEKLSRTPEGLLGVEMEDFIPALRRMLVEAERWQAGEVDALHRALMPRVQFGDTLRRRS
jgi:predicted metal-dependent hydrolase